MSGVACATPVTPSLPSSRLGARLPVGEWLPRADGTSRQQDSRNEVRPKTPLQPDGTKKPGVIREKFRSVTPAIYSNFLVPLNGTSVGKGLRG